MPHKHRPKGGLTIGEVAERTGLATSAIRHYETEGLVHPLRNSGNQRRYDRSDIRRLSFIMISQRLGFALSDIRISLNGLPDDRTPTKADWEKISRQFRRSLDARIAQMEDLRDKLDGCIGCGCLSLRTCTLYNPEDTAGTLGTGPRYLMGDAPPLT